VASSVSATQPGLGATLARYVVGLCDELVPAWGPMRPGSLAPPPTLQTTALTKRTDIVGVSYTRGVRAKLEHASAVGEKELGWSGPQFAVGARRQWGIS
jgi:hypothetical protein